MTVSESGEGVTSPDKIGCRMQYVWTMVRGYRLKVIPGQLDHEQLAWLSVEAWTHGKEVHVIPNSDMYPYREDTVNKAHIVFVGQNWMKGDPYYDRRIPMELSRLVEHG